MNAYREDPAELETERRREKGPAAFDNLVEAVLGLTSSNVQLAKMMRVSILFGSVAMLVLIGWSAYTLYSMQSTLIEIRTMLRFIIEQRP